MKTLSFTLVLVIVLCSQAFSQVGIGTTTPSTTSMLDVTSTSKGLLIPRMTQVQRAGITTPATGLLVYQTDAPAGFYVYDGSQWNLLKIRTEGGSGNMIDADGNNYPTVVIGNQEWMAENLRVTHYRNGEAIPMVSGNSAWGALATPAYCWYNNDSVTYPNHGILYNWYAVDDSRHLCPAGWHVATNSEWTTLISYLGGASVAGGLMKNGRQWQSPNTGATNSSGYSARPGGWRSGSGTFQELFSTCCFWTSTLYGSTPYYQKLVYNSAGTTELTASMRPGFFVRCMKD